MKTKIWVICLSAGLALSGFCAGSARAATNILVNPGFELGLSNWTTLWGAPATVSPIARSGVASASKNIYSVQNQDYWSQLYQEAAWAPGQPVYARVYIKTTFAPTASARAGLMLEFLNASGSVVGVIQSARVGGTTNWRLVDLNATAAPTGTVKARLSVFVWAAKDDQSSLTGAAYFDDSYLIKEYKALVLQANIRNGNFENGLNDWQDQYGFPAVVNAAVFHSGLYAAEKTVVTVTDNDYWSQLFQEISFAAGQPVYSKIWAKTAFPPLATARAGLMLQFIAADGSILQTLNSATVGGNTNWRLLDLNSTAAPQGTVKARLSAYIWAKKGDTLSVNGKMYVDDTILNKVYLPLVLQTILRNTGFENGTNDWTEAGVPSGIATTPVKAGVYSLNKTVNNVLPGDYWSQSYQTVACAPGKNVTAKISVINTASIFSSAKAGLILEFLDSSDKVLMKLTSEVGTQAAWKILTIARTAPVGTAKVRYSLFLYAPQGDLPSVGVNAYFDAAALLFL